MQDPSAAFSGLKRERLANSFGDNGFGCALWFEHFATIQKSTPTTIWFTQTPSRKSALVLKRGERLDSNASGFTEINETADAGVQLNPF